MAPRIAERVGTRAYFDQLMRLDERIRDNLATTLNAEVVGLVSSYSEGDGFPNSKCAGVSWRSRSPGWTRCSSWRDENYRGQAAIPFQNFSRYVSNGDPARSVKAVAHDRCASPSPAAPLWAA